MTDNGPSDAENATVTDVFNDDVPSLGADSSSSDATFNDLGDGQFQWTNVDVSSGSSVTFDLAVAVPSPLAAGSAFVNQASVGTGPGEIDTNPVAYATDSDVVSGTSSDANLDLAVASYNGDSVGTTTSESAPAGTDVTYQVTVANPSAGTQTNVSVPVSLPPAFTLDTSAVASDGTTSLSAGVLTWSIPSLAAGASDNLTYTETTDAPAAMESDTTTASATSDQTSSPGTASVSVNVIPASDLSIQVSDSMGSVYAGASDAYTITLTNNGPSTATNAMVSDAFSDGFIAFVAVSSLSGTSFSNLGGNEFEWSGITLPSGASATFEVLGALPTTLVSGGAYTDLATGSVPPGQADTDDTSTATDSDTVIAAPQAVTFSPPSLGVVGQIATLSASGGGSGNPVTFSVDPESDPGVCSVSGLDGTTLQYSAPGSCIVDANQTGNASYAAAATVTVTIPVDQMPAFSADVPPTTGTVGDDYAYTFTASGVPVPTFALAPGAPSWLTIDSTSGALSGTPPTGTTSFTYSVVATNGVGSTTVGPFSVAVATPPPPPPPPHLHDADISATLSCPRAIAVQSVGSCTLIVRNAGPATARFVTAELALPFRFERTGASRGGFWFGNVGTWFLGALDPDSTTTFSVSFVSFFTGRDTVVGLALAETRDSDYANNLATAPVTVTG